MLIYQKIKRYIDQGGSFSDGVALLRQVGGPYKRFESLTTRPGILPDDRVALNTALRAYYPEDQEEDAPEGTTTLVKRPQQEEITLPSRYRNDPDAVKVLRRRAIAVSKEQSLLHSKLRIAPNDDERYELAQKLQGEIVPELSRIYRALEAWENEGVIPVAPGAEERIVRETIEKYQRRESLRSGIARLKRMKKRTEKQENHLAELEAEYKELNEYLQV